MLQKKEEEALAEQRKAEKAARSYDSFLNGAPDEEDPAEDGPKMSVREMEDNFM
jgi:hypothetical protein